MPTQIDLSKIQFPDQMDLRTASIYLGLSEMRVRALARDGSIKAGKDEAGQWVFTKDDLKAFKAAPRVRKPSSRTSGDGKLWIIRVKYEDLEAVKAFLATKGIVLQPRYDYTKQNAYKAKKAAKAAAAKAAPEVAKSATAK